MSRRVLALLCALCFVMFCGGCQTVVEVIEISEEEPETVVCVDGVPLISQFPEFPAGCESTCAVMALQYAGEDITVAAFVDEYLERDDSFEYIDGVLHGPSPYQSFAGDPRDTAYGCMAPVIEQALIRYFGSDERVWNETGATLEELCEWYIDEGIPVLTWVTVDMERLEKGDSWVLPSGREYIWPRGEHCMLLVGYTETQYIFHDPYTGEVRQFRKSQVNKRLRLYKNIKKPMYQRIHRLFV